MKMYEKEFAEMILPIVKSIEQFAEKHKYFPERVLIPAKEYDNIEDYIIKTTGKKNPDMRILEIVQLKRDEEINGYILIAPDIN